MKYLAIELSNTSLKIASVNYKGNCVEFENAKVFPLPESIVNDVSLSDINGFSNFVLECIIRGGFKKGKTIVVLYDSGILMKEFTHPKASVEDLKGLVSIEAENILPTGLGGYIVQSADYSDRPDADNQYKGIIYAIKKVYVDNLNSALTKIGLQVVKIAPFIESYADIFKVLLDENVIPDLKDKTVATIHFESKKVVLTVFSDKVPIFQRVSNSASHIIDNIISETLGVSGAEVKEFKMTKGLLRGEDDSENIISLNNRIVKITRSMIEDIMRSVRTVLSVARIELDSILISGEFSFIPGLPEQIEDISGIGCHKLEQYGSEIGNLIKFKSSKDSNADLADFIGIAGAYDVKSKTATNFLLDKYGKKRESLIYSLLCAVIVFLLLIVMAYEPFKYYQTLAIKTNYENTLKENAYVTIKQKRDELKTLSDQLLQKTPDKVGIPGDNFKAAAATEKIASYMTSNIAIKSIAFDDSKKTVTLKLVTAKNKSDEITAFQNKVNAGGFFTVSGNVKTSLDEKTGIYTYDIELKLKS